MESKERYCLITVLDTISETSMPLNEFVLYRHKNYKNVKQYIFVCSDENNMILPNNLSVEYISNNSDLLMRNLKKIIKSCNQKNLKIIVHLHQIKSAIFFYKTSFLFKNSFKILFTVHSHYSARNRKYKISSMLCSLLADKTTCVSYSSYNAYSPLIKFIKKKNIIAIENGVDLKRIDQVLKLFNSEKKDRVKTIVYVGRVISIKNQALLVNIFKNLKDCKMIFIGDENENYAIRKMIDDLNLDKKITITGLLTRDEVFKLLKMSDIYVSSSTVEGLPVSVLEAMYIGLPVILSDIDSHREIAKHTSCIPLINLQIEEQWICEINKYIEMDREELIAIGNECKKCVMEYFSLQKMHQNYDRVYLELLNDK